MACRWIIDRGRTRREIAGSKSLRRDVFNRASRNTALPCALIIAKKEDPIMDDRTAQCSAKLVLVERRPRQSGKIRKVVVRIEIIVAQKLECYTVKLVAAALDGCADDGACSMAVFRSKIVCHYLEFLDGVYRWHD